MSDKPADNLQLGQFRLFLSVYLLAKLRQVALGQMERRTKGVFTLNEPKFLNANRGAFHTSEKQASDLDAAMRDTAVAFAGKILKFEDEWLRVLDSV
jgi:hypothetical protein